MTDYAKLAEMIASSRKNLKDSLAGKVSTSEMIERSILQQQLAKEKAKKDLEERKKLKEKEEKDLLFENVNRIIPQPQGAPVAVVPGRRRGRRPGSKNKNKTNNLDLATQEDLIEILEEEKKQDAEEERKFKQTDIRRFMRRKDEERNWEKILEEEERKEAEEERKPPAPKKRGRKRGTKNKPKNKSLTSRLIREARQSITGEGMKKNKKKDKKNKDKKEKPGTFPLKINKKRQNLIVELNLLMGSIKSGSSNTKMNNRAKNILKQLNK